MKASTKRETIRRYIEEIGVVPVVRAPSSELALRAAEAVLAGKDLPWAVRCGVAHGALAMTTPGDTTMATLAEVLRAMDGPNARIDR